MITQDRLKELVTYDPETGLFFRLSLIRGQGDLTKPIGSEVGNGYLDASIDGKRYYLHRIAFIYMNGEIKEDFDVDHVNHIKSDNRFSNLREVSHSVNLQNRVRSVSGGLSGYLGVTYSKRANAFVAQITINGVNRHIGCFQNPKEAHDAYVSAKRKFHQGCTI